MLQQKKTNQISLPIDSHLPQIIQQIGFKNTQNAPLILASSPGSGKTTRVPAGLLVEIQSANTSQKSRQKIIVLVPKRIAAVSAANRVAEENLWQLGQEVGFEVRFESRVSHDTQLIFMTPGTLIQKLIYFSKTKHENSNFLKSIGWIFFDEFHERLLENDMLLAFFRERKILHDDHQIVLMSATLNALELKKYLNTENTFEINERPFKLDIHYQSKPQSMVCDRFFYDNLKETIKNILLNSKKFTIKNILIFLPGTPEIRRAKEILVTSFPNLQFHEFHGRLKLEEQQTVLNALQKNMSGSHHIVLATNIAETSLTLPLVNVVIDSGLEKRASTVAEFDFTQLDTRRISKFSAIQRAGRAARQFDGQCYRLWHRSDELSMSSEIIPEIREKPISEILLKATLVSDSNPMFIEWLNPPSDEQINKAINDLKELRLIDENLTPTWLGKHICDVPLSIKDSFLFLGLVGLNHAEFACDYFSRLAQAKPLLHHLDETESDIDYILGTPLSFEQKKTHSQLVQVSRLFSVIIANAKWEVFFPFQKTEYLSAIEAFIFLHFQFLKNRIVKKNVRIDLSYSGRGVELNSFSSACRSPFYIVLTGTEKKKSASTVQLALPIQKKFFLELTKDKTKTQVSVEFDEEQKLFFQVSSIKFGQIPVNEDSRKKISQSEIQAEWAQLLETSQDALFKENISYQNLIGKAHFIIQRSELFGLAVSTSDLEKLKLDFIDFAKSQVTSYQELVNINFSQLVRFSEIALYQAIFELPDFIVLANGKNCLIDYLDQKAPLISSRIQDFFGQMNTPTISHCKIAVTCVMLAPNNRPTQTTQNLQAFWTGSYQEIRRELKSRYPKHFWPEVVTTSTPSRKN